ncbi:methylated-DNA--[protein]-cysteine S-methyltransferase [Bordetella avium]|uniref:Methylated-DNA--protein-cysteine methyltransferase n=1 Tax=Bordetella avium (strain 197N) TaxID=360910 RepID=Q2KU90_BORA1|nr:methylated-DNA--[protein]-cysteine S-methyltransferase [Bordetella avium]AZY50491.1 methylated-DNA--[protein]-cysteine S-methyltransferase [Bordetella avium]AZY53887.1 methylated-DNA--[protein]-cysteine S-methyltransferase [Bordetella avium]RIQ15340.1 methylated-DNA--[protein]-cysteine S-methyltransferase [Bordetella avium]RIQ19855.1 methylated-DNA--[protein]-cysteine S-methyltransferase [Bordetella avium]RIQ34434.1 methylated-DNA--[protein]-cysteine S-methyltransferase [Bordetella avium]
MIRGIEDASALDIDTPLGGVRLMASGLSLCGLWFADQPELPEPGRGASSAAERAVLGRAQEQLRAWFAGERQDFDLPLAPRGTAFQQAVWAGLLDLPFGVTISYSELARLIGRPRATRALAQAVGRNPISIIIPCHRVIGQDTALTGFGGGLDRKQRLLAHEGHRYSGRSARARRVCDGQMDLPW